MDYKTLDRIDILYGTNYTPQYEISIGDKIESIKEIISDNWISIEDEMPSDKDYYLIWDKIDEKLFSVKISYFDKHTFDRPCTHWMPLPRPPKDEE